MVRSPAIWKRPGALRHSMNPLRRRGVRSVPAPRYAAAGAFAELRNALSYLPHDIVPIAEARLPVKAVRSDTKGCPPARAASGNTRRRATAAGAACSWPRPTARPRRRHPQARRNEPYQLAGSVVRPRKTKVCRQSGCSGSSSCSLGKRRNSVAIAISPSMRASWAPRQ